MISLVAQKLSWANLFSLGGNYYLGFQLGFASEFHTQIFKKSELSQVSQVIDY